MFHAVQYVHTVTFTVVQKGVQNDKHLVRVDKLT